MRPVGSVWRKRQWTGRLTGPRTTGGGDEDESSWMTDDDYDDDCDVTMMLL